MTVPAGSVWLDARATQGGGSAERGLGRHVVEVLRAMHSIAPDLLGSIRLDPDQPEPAALDWLTGSGLLGWGSDEPGREQQIPSIYHVPAPFEAADVDRIWPTWIRSGRYPIRTVVTLHDLIPLALADQYLTDNLYFKTVYTARLGLVRHAHHVLAISENTAADAVEYLGVDPGRITLIESGVSDTFSSLVGSAEDADEILGSSYPQVRRGFLLYVGGGDPRKNMRGAIEAFARLPTGLRNAHQLVIVSRLGPQATGELRVYGRRLGIDDADLVFAGFVSDRELAALYRRCELFLFPSLYEGFGLPILEAMSCGAPVAAGNNSSIPEVLGDLDGTFDAADPADIAATVRDLLEHPERLEDLRERSSRRLAHFSWEKTARKVLEGYERALASPVGPGRRAERPRAALVTPWPPEGSFAALGSERLARSMLDRIDLDVIVASGEGGFDRSLPPPARFWGADELPWLHELRDHDRYLYVLDGSPTHGEILDALCARPGAVLLHDVGLAPLIPETAQWLIVHSRHELELLQRERPARAAALAVVPAPIPAAPPTLNGVAVPAGPLLVSGGRLDVAGKRLDVLLEAFALIASARPGARLVLLGEASERERSAVERLADRLDVMGIVEVRGRVGSSEYWSTLQMADVAVQLRAEDKALSVSGSVCDALAARTPAVVSEVGWFAELPEPVVFHVDADCTKSRLASTIGAVMDDEALASRARSAQGEYAVQNSYERLAARLLELLDVGGR
jgi:glycosyltransferase involved in cell wall biosynthesis